MDQLTEQEVRAFVGSRADRYLSKWGPALEGNGAATGFNWAAFFFSGMWLPYRKMYLVTTICFGVVLLEGIIEEVVFVGILGKPEAPRALDRAVAIAAALVCGGLGNRWYLSHTRKAISEVRAQGLPGNAYLEALAKRGGTNIVASFGFFIAFIAAVFVLLFLEDLLLPGS